MTEVVVVGPRPTGLILPDEHPKSKAAYEDPANWPMSLLMEGVPYTAPPPEYTCPGVRSTALDQDGVGACVAFSGTLIKDVQERTDQGAWLYDTPAAFKNYDYLKHGTPDGSWLGDGIDSEGSIPQYFWEMTRKYGAVDKTGKPWKISAWYSHKLESASDLEFLQQVLMAFGPVSFGTAWPANWFGAPSAANDYKMPAPSGSAGGHAYTCIGWKNIAGVIWLTFVNSWGYWGSAQGLFRALGSWFYVSPLGPQIFHKVIDVDDPPAPTPPGGDIVKAYDSVPRTFDAVVGTQFYKQDGTTPLTKLASGGIGLYSPCKWDSANFNVVISTGGVRQQAVVRATAVTNVKSYNDCTAAVAAEHKRWDDWLLTAPK